MYATKKTNVCFICSNGERNLLAGTCLDICAPHIRGMCLLAALDSPYLFTPSCFIERISLPACDRFVCRSGAGRVSNTAIYYTEWLWTFGSALVLRDLACRGGGSNLNTFNIHASIFHKVGPFICIKTQRNAMIMLRYG
jgi:hypothetical protein